MGEFYVFPGRFEPVRLEIAHEPGEQFVAASFRKRAAQVFSRQRPERQRRIGQEPAILPQRDFRETDLELPAKKVIGVLNAGDTGKVGALGDFQNFISPQAVSLETPMARIFPALT